MLSSLLLALPPSVVLFSCTYDFHSFTAELNTSILLFFKNTMKAEAISRPYHGGSLPNVNLSLGQNHIDLQVRVY